MIDVVHFLGGYPVEPVDIHASIRHLDAISDSLTLFDKPIHAYSLGRQRNVDALEMVRLAHGLSEEELDRLEESDPVAALREALRDLGYIEGQNVTYEARFAEGKMEPLADLAAELVRLAHERKLVLQVGHVERFNPVFSYLETAAPEPRFIECHRLSPFPARSTDIGVVLDLMIHDLDVVLAFVRSPVVSVDAVGIPVLSKSEDIANARLRFANGCVANLTASRISPERLRKIRVFSGGAQPSYISLDYREQKGFIYRLARDGEEESSLLKKLLSANDSAIVSEFAGKKITREPVPIAKDEPLKLELAHFVECVRERRTPKVSGASAKHALDVAFEITSQIRSAESTTAAQRTQR